MKNKIVGFVLAMSLIVPMTSSAYFTEADVAEELQSQIASLLKQVEELKIKLANMQGDTTGKWCHTFGSDLKIGSRNSEVAHLLTALVKSGVAKERGSNFSEDYDEVIASYVTAFQEKYRDEILTPAGLNNGTGYLGARTRSMLNKLYGCNVNTPVETGNKPYITGPSSNFTSTNLEYYVANFSVDPQQSSSGKMIDYTWNVSGLPSGLQANVNYCAPKSVCTAVHNPYLFTIYGTPSKAGKYTMMITAKNSEGVEVRHSFTLEVKDASFPLTVTYPNGGEKLVMGNTYTIKWTSPKDVSSSAGLAVKLIGTDNTERLLGTVTNNGDKFEWRIRNCGVGNECSSNFQIPADKYKIRISGPQGEDESDSYFSVVSPDISTSSNKPDLIVGSTYCSPGSPTTSTMISCEVTVKNNSSVDVTKNFDVNIQGSAVTVQAPLKAWESRTIKSPDKFGLTIVGWNLLTFPVDIWNNVDESNEANNSGYLKINVTNNSSTGAYEVSTGLCTSVSRTWGNTYVDIEGGSLVRNGIGYVVDGAIGVTAGANATANMYAYVPDGFSKGQISVTTPNTVEDEYIRARGVLIAQVRSSSNPSEPNSQYGGIIQSITPNIAKCPSYP